jgi:hypothetical protein
MALSVFTLADMQRGVIAMMRGVFSKTNESYGNDWIRNICSESCVEIQRECEIYTKHHSFDLVAGRSYYGLPSDLLEDRIIADTVMVSDRAGGWTSPKQLRWGDMVKVYGDFSNPSGSSSMAHWAIGGRNMDPDAGTFRQFVLMFPPGANMTGGGSYDYIPHPGNLVRVFDQSESGGSITVAFTNGLDTATFSSSMAGNLMVDDAIGVMSSSSGLPSRWYRIADFDGTTGIVIDPPYIEPSTTTASFVVSQVSPLEWFMPGVTRTAVQRYAAWRLFEADNGHDAAHGHRQSWLAELGAIRSRVNRGDQMVPALDRVLDSRFPSMFRRI